MEANLKPEKQTKVYYDYDSCKDYIDSKHGISKREYKGNWRLLWDDFAQTIYDFYGSDSFFTISSADLDEIEEFGGQEAREIAGYFVEEFADKNGQAVFMIDWD